MATSNGKTGNARGRPKKRRERKSDSKAEEQETEADLTEHECLRLQLLGERVGRYTAEEARAQQQLQQVTSAKNEAVEQLRRLVVGIASERGLRGVRTGTTIVYDATDKRKIWIDESA